MHSRLGRGGSGKADKGADKLREWDSDKGEGVEDVFNGRFCFVNCSSKCCLGLGSLPKLNLIQAYEGNKPINLTMLKVLCHGISTVHCTVGLEEGLNKLVPIVAYI